MPVVFTSVYKSTFDPTYIKYRGTQYIDGPLTFNGTTTINLNDSIFNSAGRYVLFKYGSFPGGQTDLDNYVKNNIIDTGLTNAYYDVTDPEALIDDTVNKYIIIKLKTPPTVGKQYIDGNLTLGANVRIYLSKDLYKTAATYELFETTGGTITLDPTVRAIMGGAVLKAGIPYLTDSNTKLKVDIV